MRQNRQISLALCSAWLLLLIALASSCSKDSADYSMSAVATDFDGVWKGDWSWNSGQATTLEIAGNQAKAMGFPIKKDLGEGPILVANGTAVVKFDPQYGGQGAPCVLIFVDGSPGVVPLYLSRNKKQLIYSVSTSERLRVIFTRRQ